MSTFTSIVSILAITFSLVFLLLIFILLLCYFFNWRRQRPDADGDVEPGSSMLFNLRTRKFSVFIKSNENQSKSEQNEASSASSNNLKKKSLKNDKSIFKPYDKFF